MWMYLRRGVYRKVVKHLRAMALLRPGNFTVESARQLFSTLAEYPSQVVSSSGPSELPYNMVDGNLFLPVSINGVSCHAMPDSGASISLISESDAAHLGMQIHWLGPRTLQIYGATGTQSDFGVAMASQLGLGRFCIKHVVLLVVKDDRLPFPAGYRVALGLPVLLALRTMRWSRDATFSFGFASSQSYSSKANLSFDGTDLIANTTVGDDPASVVIDTGSASTVLWPPFAQRFPAMMNQSASYGSSFVDGISGSAEFPHLQLPEVNLHLGDQSLLVRPAYVLTQVTTPNSRWLFGRVGVDALQPAAPVTIDFNAMRLHVQGRAN
jgi:predicted aspartyl protease